MMHEIDFLRTWILSYVDQWGAKRRQERGAVEVTSTVVMLALVTVIVIATIAIVGAKIKSKASSIDLG